MSISEGDFLFLLFSTCILQIGLFILFSSSSEKRGDCLKQFMIGQYGGFDHKKYTRDFRADFYGIEACLFATTQDAIHLIHEARQTGWAIGIHYPFYASPSSSRDALFMSPDQAVREHAFYSIQQQLEIVKTMQPDYVLFHYPKPVILDDRVNWSTWRFADRSEYILESECSFDEFVDRSEGLFQWLTEKSDQYDFTPVLEFDALTTYIYDNNFLENLLARYPKIKLCLDTGRLFLQELIDPNFDARKVIRTFAKYAYIVHLWTFQMKDTIQHLRHPVLPELRQTDGWAPIKEYLKIIREENQHVKIMFEHNSQLVNDEQLDRCYAWVKEILNISSGNDEQTS
jgi:adenylate kinase family enzyme